jgi:putative oxidoreductase
MFDAFVKNTVFIFHGSQKVTAEGNQWGAAWMNAAAAQKDAAPPPAPVQIAVAWGELLGGIALGLGFLTRLAALGIIAIMAGAIVLVHGEHGFSAPAGYEYNMLIIAACVALVLLGGGNLAVDRFLRLRRRS